MNKTSIFEYIIQIRPVYRDLSLP